MSNRFPGVLVSDALDRMGRNPAEHIIEYHGDEESFALNTDAPNFLAMFAVEVCRQITDTNWTKQEVRDELFDDLTNMIDSARDCRSNRVEFTGWHLS